MSKSGKKPLHRCGGPPPLLGEAGELMPKPPMKGEVKKLCPASLRKGRCHGVTEGFLRTFAHP